MAQGFPSLDTPLVDATNGTLSLPWFQFLVTIWNRTGGPIGVAFATLFNYPATTGDVGQVLTSEGHGNPTIWTTLFTKLSQFTNDAGFITTGAISDFITSDQAAGQTQDAIDARASNTLPLVDTPSGSIGISDHLSRADHSHPLPHSETFGGTVTASRFITGSVSWTSGSGTPSSIVPTGSLYSNTSGGTGSRLYVSNGAGWNAVAGV